MRFHIFRQVSALKLSVQPPRDRAFALAEPIDEIPTEIIKDLMKAVGTSTWKKCVEEAGSVVQRLDALWTQRVVALCEQPVAKGEKEKGKAVQKENVEAEKPADAQASTSSGQGAADTAGVGDMPEVARAADDDASEGLPAKGACDALKVGDLVITSSGKKELNDKRARVIALLSRQVKVCMLTGASQHEEKKFGYERVTKAPPSPEAAVGGDSQKRARAAALFGGDTMEMLAVIQPSQEGV